MGLFDGRGTTTVRSRWARRLDGENTDHLMAVVPIPPGCTINRMHLNHFAVAEKALPLRQATEYGFHGYIVTIPQPYHGYGDGLDAFENMWDDMVPKDRDADLELDTYDDMSVADDNMQNDDSGDNKGAIEGGFGGSDGSETGASNINAVLNLGAGPEMVFSRVKRLDVTNGIISESEKFTAVDKVQTTLTKRYHVPSDKYGWLMFAVGLPKLEEADTFEDGGIWDQAYQTDMTWQHLAHPEISLLAGLYGSDGSDTGEQWSAMLQKNLEVSYIQDDTYHDVNETAPQALSCYTNLTVQYQRPRFEQLHLTSRDTV